MPQPDRKPLPAIVVVILALLGLGTLQRGSSTRSGAESPAGSAGAPSRPPGQAPVLEDGRSGDEAILRPLLEYYDGSDRATLGRVAERTDGTPGKDELKCLIALLPDPVGSTNSYRFDEFVGAIQRAVESQMYVFDGYRFPWGGHPEKDGRDAGADRQGPKPASPGQAQPGAILFRGKKDDRGGGTPLLLALVVPETPTRGVDKGILLKSLDLAGRWDVRNRGTRPGGEGVGAGPHPTFNILGPTFSGSQASLERALAGYRGPDKTGECCTFEFITGSATEVKPAQLRRVVGADSHHVVRFRSTVHTTEALQGRLLGHVNQSHPIALLVESNTGFGASLQAPRPGAERDPRRPFQNLIHYPFPLHISRLRSLYEKKGLLHGRDAQPLRTAERLTISSLDAGNSRDIIKSETPEVTTAIDELTLTQTLTDIARRQIRTVGIMATDPLDVVFLAREVRRFCSDVQLFTTQANLIYSHPQYVSDLRGMLVGSSYPLCANNQAWSYSYRGDNTHHFFASDNAQGTYNAAVAQLFAMGIRNLPPRFLEYGTPFAPPGGYSRDAAGSWSWTPIARTPPIWISIVGYRGLYPVRVYDRSPPRGEAVPAYAADDEAYVYRHDEEDEEYLSLGLTHPSSWAKDEANGRTDAERIRNWFRPTLVFLWSFLFAGFSAACLLLVCVTGLHLAWLHREPGVGDAGAFGIGRIELGRVARFLNCPRPAATAGGGSGCRGPGGYLLFALLLLFFLYLTVALPMFRLLRIGWLPIYLPHAEFIYVAFAYVVVMLLIAGLIMALTALLETWQRPRRRDRAGGGATATARRGRVLRGVCLIWLVLLIAGPLVIHVRASLLAVSPEMFTHLSDDQRRSLLDFERMMAVSSGVSPVFPMLFLAVAGLAWVYSQLKRRYVFDQCTLDSPTGPARPAPGTEGDDGWADRPTLLEVRRRRIAFEDALNRPFRSLFRGNSAYTLLHVGFVVFFLFPAVHRVWRVLWRTTQIQEGVLFECVTWVVFLVLFLLLTVHAFQLVVIWKEIHGILDLALKLPLVSALERIPPRVGRWFFETPPAGNHRSEVIRRQANALAARSTDDVRQGLDSLAGGSFASEAAWDDLKASLETGGPRLVAAARGTLMPLLEATWSSIPVESAFAEPTEGGAVAAGSGPQDPGAGRLADWVRQAEDLVALLFVRWLAASLSQVWILIGFLVVGSLSLLLAISSYPFPLQGHLMLGLGLLIGFLILAILRIVIGLNRNEVISRISNTTPNRIDLDGALVSNLLRYIVPLAGVLAAFSFETSDLIRTVLDPILRHLR